jgi:hypothetical protein
MFIYCTQRTLRDIHPFYLIMYRPLGLMLTDRQLLNKGSDAARFGPKIYIYYPIVHRGRFVMLIHFI